MCREKAKKIHLWFLLAPYYLIFLKLFSLKNHISNLLNQEVPSWFFCFCFCICFFGCTVWHAGSQLPGIEPAPPAVEGRILHHWAAREVPIMFCLFVCLFFKEGGTKTKIFTLNILLHCKSATDETLKQLCLKRFLVPTVKMQAHLWPRLKQVRDDGSSPLAVGRGTWRLWCTTDYSLEGWSLSASLRSLPGRMAEASFLKLPPQISLVSFVLSSTWFEKFPLTLHVDLPSIQQPSRAAFPTLLPSDLGLM